MPLRTCGTWHVHLFTITNADQKYWSHQWGKLHIQLWNKHVIDFVWNKLASFKCWIDNRFIYCEHQLFVSVLLLMTHFDVTLYIVAVNPRGVNRTDSQSVSQSVRQRQTAIFNFEVQGSPFRGLKAFCYHQEPWALILNDIYKIQIIYTIKTINNVNYKENVMSKKLGLKCYLEKIFKTMHSW